MRKREEIRETAVRFLSRTGNTEKLAGAVAGAVGVPAEDLTVPLCGPVEILFLGTAVYAGGLDRRVKTFLEDNRENIGSIAAFSTAALLPGTFRQLRKLCRQLEIPLLEPDYHCMGKFGPMHNGRPNRRDCERAAQWAQTVLQEH